MNLEVDIKIKMLTENHKLFELHLAGIIKAIENYYSNQVTEPYEYKIWIGEVRTTRND